MALNLKNVRWFFVLAFFIAESLLLIIASITYQERKDHFREDHTNQLKSSYEAVFNSFGLVSQLIYEQNINTSTIKKLYSRAYEANEEQRKQIRDSLYFLLNPTFEKLSTSAIKQLHFHLPDNTSFLRFHSPDRFGDDLTKVRESVRLANAEKRLVTGFEEGKVYNGFRFVYPLSYNDKHIGTVEVSVSFGAISQFLNQKENEVYSLILKKSVINEKLFPDFLSNYQKSKFADDWVEEVRFQHLGNANTVLTKEILIELDRQFSNDYQDRLALEEPFTLFLSVGNLNYAISFLPIYNLKNQHVAYVVSYATENSIHNFYAWSIWLVIIGTVSFIFISILFYALYTKQRTIEIQNTALIESDDRYKEIYNTVEIGILSNSLEGDILMANPKMLDILGYSSLAELQKNNIKDIYVRPELREELLKEMMIENADHVSGEALWKHKKGGTVLIKFTGKRHFSSEGFPFIESVVQDVTLLRQLEIALKESEKNLRESVATKDRFFSIIAHDLRGPFNSLLGITELLTQHPETIEESQKQKFLQLIYASVQNLSNLIENLLDWSRSQEGSLQFFPKEYSLLEIIKETTELLSETAYAKQITILTDIDHSLLVKVDANMAKTIFRNVISNAIKFTHRSGLVKIYTKEIRKKQNVNFIEICIEDNGVGISEKEIEKLFKIDSGYSNLGTEKEKGTGLGLVLVKDFLDKHRGEVSIISEKGLGTKVIFTLPLITK